MLTSTLSLINTRPSTHPNCILSFAKPVEGESKTGKKERERKCKKKSRVEEKEIERMQGKKREGKGENSGNSHAQ